MMAELTFEGIGRRIKQARLSAGFTQEHLASKIGVDRTAISLIEQGKRQVNGMELMEIAEVLGYPMEFFFPPETADAPEEASSFDQLQAAFRARGDLQDQDVEKLAWARSLLFEFVSLKKMLRESQS